MLNAADKLLSALGSGNIILTEGSVIERIRRFDHTLLEPNLLHAPLIYTEAGCAILRELHRQYIEIACRFNLPLLTFTDTWRVNFDRLKRAGMLEKDVNGDCVRFLRRTIAESADCADNVYVSGLIGCKGDAYKPDEALSEQGAATFHSFQIDALAAAGVDFLFAATMPSLSEAAGIAEAMSHTGIPYIISFVLNQSGLILDGTSVYRAIAAIDAKVTPPPLFYMANCCHPRFYEAAMRELLREDALLLQRIIGLQANTSAKGVGELDNLAFLDSEEPSVFAELMTDLHNNFGTKILGGCCGSDNRHIAAIAEKARSKKDI